MALPEPSPPSGDLVDLAAAVALRRAVGAAAFAELAADMLFETEERLARIEAELASGDLDAGARVAHDLAGVSGAIGLAEVSAAARALERACASGAPGRALGAWRRLSAAGRPSLSAARALFSRLG